MTRRDQQSAIDVAGRRLAGDILNRHWRTSETLMLRGGTRATLLLRIGAATGMDRNTARKRWAERISIRKRLRGDAEIDQNSPCAGQCWRFRAEIPAHRAASWRKAKWAAPPLNLT
ncbi:MAG TPA: hypothetical protein VKU82_04985, partial [Planctomycetaceae bacterium]|nr:hypothetical protein [Planctomycetaceae bacterium]